MRESDMRTALLISGEGTTAEVVIRACQGGELGHIRPVVVISSRPEAPGLARAKALGVSTGIVQRQGRSPEAFGDELLTILRQYGVDLVSQNGWLPLTPANVIAEYDGKIINQHPGRLPAFGGKGMFGARVTCATLGYFVMTGESNPWTASTVHFVTEGIDQGAAIFVRTLMIAPQNMQESLADWTRRVQGQLLPIEHDCVKRALSVLGEGKIPMAEHDDTLFREDKLQLAKQQAIQLFPKG